MTSTDAAAQHSAGRDGQLSGEHDGQLSGERDGQLSAGRDAQLSAARDGQQSSGQLRGRQHREPPRAGGQRSGRGRQRALGARGPAAGGPA